MRPVGVTAYAAACGISRNGVYKAIERGDVVQREDGKVDLDNSTNRTYQEHCQANEANKTPAKKKALSKKKKKTGTSKAGNKVKKKAPAAGKGKSKGVEEKKSDAENGAGSGISASEMEPPGDGDQGILSYGQDLDLDTIPPELLKIFANGIGDNKKVNLDSLKVLEEIKSKIQDRKQKRSRLVERDLVREFCGKLWVVDTTELKPLGIRFAPDIASLVQKAVEVIRNEEPEYKASPILSRVNEFVNSTDFMRSINEIATGEVMKTLEHIKRIMDEFLQEMGSEPMEDLPEPDQAEPEHAEVVG